MAGSFHAIIDASTLNDWLDTFTAIVDEAVLEISADGIYGEAVDPANVAMVNQTLHAEAFESFDTTGLKVGVAFDRFKNFLDSIRSELVELDYNEETRKLDIRGDETNLTLGIIDPDSVRDGVDVSELDIDHTADVQMDGAAWNHAVDVTTLVSDHVTIDTDPSRESPLHVTGDGDVDSASVEFNSALHEGSTVDTPAVSLFSETYMESFASAIPGSVDLHVKVGNETPVR